MIKSTRAREFEMALKQSGELIIMTEDQKRLGKGTISFS